MRFAPEYVACVLNENFEDAKAQFLSPLMAIHYAHLVMLARQQIVRRDDARAIRDALDGIDVDEVRRIEYDGTCEDLFFYLERLIVQRAGDEAAGRLHTARSRNDIDMTMYRMQTREMLLALFDGGLRLRRVLLDLAAAHPDAVFPAHTHTQPAQPTTIAHYLLAVVEMLERDAVRLAAAYDATNCNPLGSCAITGTGFPIDRQQTTALLGFDRPTGNTYGSIATVDHLLEGVSAATVMLAGIGRVVQDLLFWCTSEVGYLRLSDGFVQCSSIMPQKRNPVALEHARAIASKALGQAGAIVLTIHNTPFGDIVDTEDDLQPLVFATFRDATRAVRLVAAALADAQFDTARMAARAARGWITVTELADSLAREHDVPFKAAHAIAARVVGSPPDGGALASRLSEAARAVLGRPIEVEEGWLQRVLSAEYFVAVRRTPGGPAPEETRRAAAASDERARADAAWMSAAVERLRAAEEALRTAAAEL